MNRVSTLLKSPFWRKFRAFFINQRIRYLVSVLVLYLLFRMGPFVLLNSLNLLLIGIGILKPMILAVQQLSFFEVGCLWEWTLVYIF